MNRGILCALAAAALFGLSTPLAKLALAAAPPLLVAGLLYLGSGLGLALVRRLIRRSARSETPLRSVDVPWLAGAILTGGVLAPALLLFGLLHSPASTVSLLLNLEAVATAAIAWLVFRENVDRRVGLGFAGILLGGIVLALPGTAGFGLSSGALFVAGACLCWGIDNNLTRRISGSDPAQIAMWKGLVAGATNTALALATGASFPPPSVAIGVGAIEFLGYGVSLVLFVLALRHLGTARTGAYFSTAPFVGAAFALALGQDRLDWALGLSGGLMLLGVWLHVSERHAPRPRRAPPARSRAGRSHGGTACASPPARTPAPCPRALPRPPPPARALSPVRPECQPRPPRRGFGRSVSSASPGGGGSPPRGRAGRPPPRHTRPAPAPR